VGNGIKLGQLETTNEHRYLSIKWVKRRKISAMSYSGEERRLSERVEKLEHTVLGNGEPGLRGEVDKINAALYGDSDNKQRGMIDKQEDILKFVYSVRPFLHPKLLLLVIALSITACLKVLGLDLITDVVHKFI